MGRSRSIRIARVFPRRTSYTPDDDLVFVGEPGLFRPDVDEVHVSCTFTWDLAEAERLRASWACYYKRVKLGGPALDDPGGEFIPGKYVKNGVTITSRGCPKQCPWCVVPKREGGIRLLKVRPGRIVNDNNLFACTLGHISSVFEMLESQRRIVFSGGIDITLLHDWQVAWLRENARRIQEMWFAADSDRPSMWKALEHTADIRFGSFSRKKLRCYVLIGWKGETVEQAEKRLQRTWDVGFLPFAQFYRGPGEQRKTREWYRLQKTWTRPAAMYSMQKSREDSDD